MSKPYINSLESERLRYRPLNIEDATVWTTFVSDPESFKLFPKMDNSPSDRAQLWVEAQLERYKKGTYGMMAIELKTTGEFIGQCGLLLQEVNGKEELEVGYHLLRKHEGNGYATEASKHFRNYALLNKIAPSVISIIVKSNLKSIAVAERNGLRKDFETNWKGFDVYIYRTTEVLA